MDSAHAIMIAPGDTGWAWRLVDLDGSIVASGIAGSRTQALRVARTAGCAGPDVAGAESRTWRPGASAVNR